MLGIRGGCDVLDTIHNVYNTIDNGITAAWISAGGSVLTGALTVGLGYIVFKSDRNARKSDRHIELRKESYLQMISSGYAMLGMISKIYIVPLEDLAELGMKYNQYSADLMKINLIGTRNSIEAVVTFNSNVMHAYQRAMRNRQKIDVEYNINISNGLPENQILYHKAKSTLTELNNSCKEIFEVMTSLPDLVLKLRRDLETVKSNKIDPDFYENEYLIFMQEVINKDFISTSETLEAVINNIG